MRAFAKRKNEDEIWVSELIKKMQGTLQQPGPAKSGSAVPTRLSFDLPYARRASAARAFEGRTEDE